MCPRAFLTTLVYMEIISSLVLGNIHNCLCGHLSNIYWDDFYRPEITFVCPIQAGLVSYLWEHKSPRCVCGVPSRAILFAYMNFIEK